MSYKIIHDAVHGSIKIEGLILDLFHAPVIQRLRDIKQLGLTNLVFPGANHTRFEHSLGVYYLTNEICEELDIEKGALTAAATLHDCGHTPFSHTLEPLSREYLGKDHVDLACKRVLDLRDTLEKYAVKPEKVIKILKGKEEGYESQIIAGDLDVDRIDYLLRDAHYTGVAHGIIDVERILKTIEIRDDTLGINEKGILAVEGMLTARDLMYASVYFHKTARICESMLARAVECVANEENVKEITRMTDTELLSLLKNAEGFPGQIYKRLKYRDLFKLAASIDLSLNLKERKELEREICEKAGIPEHYCVIDIPEPKGTERIEIKVFDEGSKSFTDHTFFRNSTPTRYPVIISTPEKYRKKVKEVVGRIL
ncbi:MAG: HD domain-containing protein [Euryarchaeota archaeon]|nr:HD domain-containing protein [Euryarchaeota archaeon]